MQPSAACVAGSAQVDAATQRRDAALILIDAFLVIRGRGGWWLCSLRELWHLRSTLYGLEQHLVSIHKAVNDFQPARVVVDPITRIEGHLRIDCEIDGGKVTNAWSSGQMWRGIEIILKGRDPRDAPTFAQRICGV